MIFSDVLEAISILKSTLLDANDNFDAENKFKINKFNNKSRSISRRAKDAICYFPVLTSRSISYEEVTMINKVLERQFTTYLRVAIGLDDELEEGISKKEFISRFHVNLDKQIGSVNLLNSVLDGLKESNVPYTVAKDQFVSPMLESHLQSIRSSLLRTVPNFSPLKEDALAPIGRVLTENAKRKQKNDRSEPAGRQGNEIGFGEKEDKQTRYYRSNSTLLDNDVKKANEVIPTTLNIELRVKGSDSPTNILMGVKTITHPIDSEEMIFNIASAIREKRIFFRTIQWTTGEIKFFKDFVLSMDTIRKNVEQTRNKNNWWRSLRRLSLSSKYKRYVNRDDIIPNTSIVLSMDEVEYITNSYGINLLKDTKSVIKLIEHYHLLSFAIVDSSSELAYFLFDGDSNFQTFSFNALERENRNAGNDMKALVSLMTR